MVRAPFARTARSTAALIVPAIYVESRLQP